MIDIDIKTGQPYKVKVGKGLILKLGDLLKEVKPSCKVAVVADQNVANLYMDTVLKSLKEAGYETIAYTFAPGEEAKSFKEFSRLLEFLAQNELGRKDLILALGGGVTGDLAGFAAASFLRGLAYAQVPTSLLAAVDSSVGGKTAINLSRGKNLVGAFWQPSLVVFDTDVLKTLPKEELSAGAAECVKYAMLYDKDLLELFKKDGLNANWADVVAKCVKFKADVVKEDEKEQGLRKFLNFGHTVGHAIELLSNFSIRHGESVSIGMVILSRAAEKQGIAQKGTVQSLISALKALDLPIKTSFEVKDIAKATLGDKKRQGDKISLILPKSVGSCFLQDVSFDDLGEMIKIGMEEEPCV